MINVGESRLEARVGRASLLDAKTRLLIRTWNVRTMFDTLRTMQVIREMQRYKLHILGVSECRCTGFGQHLTATGETILYSGRDDNHHSAGVALILKRGLKNTLIEWQPVNERLIRARFNGKHAKLSIIQCYAPTNDADDEEKDAFYIRLQEEKRCQRMTYCL